MRTYKDLLTGETRARPVIEQEPIVFDVPRISLAEACAQLREGTVKRHVYVQRCGCGRCGV
jgi:hypothetical protein